jgi:hypothetical protein
MKQQEVMEDLLLMQKVIDECPSNARLIGHVRQLVTELIFKIETHGITPDVKLPGRKEIYDKGLSAFNVGARPRRSEGTVGRRSGNATGLACDPGNNW